MRSEEGNKVFTRWVVALAVGAVALRLVLFLGRGDYLAFDEGWYLLLGRSLYSGDGYSLIGIPHTTLSPLFPIMAGGVGSLLGNWVWGGRLVAALASGLLILPLWAIFNRIAPARTAFTAAVLVAVLPTMAPFTVPFFVGADLWVGAEPLLHLFLFTGIFLWLKALEKEGFLFWCLSGTAFGLAFLSRPEAIITWGLLGLAALASAALKRSPRRLVGAALMGVGFLVVGAPYWNYLHEVNGEWALTGRGINAGANAAKMISGTQRGGPSSTIEGMLWMDDESYVQRLYGLDESGLRLGSDYWGVYPPAAEVTLQGGPTPPENPPLGPETATVPPSPSGEALQTPQSLPPFPFLFGRALRTTFPALLWIFVFLGLFARRAPGALRKEIPLTLSLVGTSLAIALLVAVDPRTQLFLVPLLALYAAKGFEFLDLQLGHRVRSLTNRTSFLQDLLLAITVISLLGVSLNRLYLSLSFGSPHHTVAAQNRQVAQELNVFLGTQEGPVASWHPGIAVYADRDWRVLPYADLRGIVRFAGASGAEVAVLSAYYPPFRGEEILGTRYLILPIPANAGTVEEWEVEPVAGDTIRGLGRLQERSGPEESTPESGGENR